MERLLGETVKTCNELDKIVKEQYEIVKEDKSFYKGLVLLEEKPFVGPTSIKYWM